MLGEASTVICWPDGKSFLRPAGPPQDVNGSHLAAMMADLAVLLRDVEVDPRMRIDHVDAGQFALELDGFGEVVFSAAVMREGKRGNENGEQE